MQNPGGNWFTPRGRLAEAACLQPLAAFVSKWKNPNYVEVHWRLVAYWTPHGLSERRVALGTSTSGWEISYLQGAVDAMLRHAYEQGRVDASLGV